MQQQLVYRTVLAYWRAVRLSAAICSPSCALLFIATEIVISDFACGLQLISLECICNNVQSEMDLCIQAVLWSNHSKLFRRCGIFAGSLAAAALLSTQIVAAEDKKLDQGKTLCAFCEHLLQCDPAGLCACCRLNLLMVA